MKTYEFHLSRVVLVRQTAVLSVVAADEDNALDLACDTAEWRTVKILNNEGVEVDNVRDLG